MDYKDYNKILGLNVMPHRTKSSALIESWCESIIRM